MRIKPLHQVDPYDETLWIMENEKPAQYYVKLPADCTPMIPELLRESSMTAGDLMRALVYAAWLAKVDKPIPRLMPKKKPKRDRGIEPLSAIYRRVKSDSKS